MKAVLASLLFILTCAPARAIDYRWISGANMGEVAASIKNKSGDKLYFYCTAGQEEKKAGLYVELAKKRHLPNKIDAQFVIDGKNYPLQLVGLSFDARGRAFFNDLYSLVSALTQTKSPTFKMELPVQNLEFTFSTLNAVDALGKPPRSLLDSCA